VAIFGARSLAQLATCHDDIARVLAAAIKEYDFSVLKGHRPKSEQNACHASGASQLRWPASLHNHQPSLAVDIVPYPIDWESLNRFHDLAEVVKKHAADCDVNLVWGYDLWRWDMPHWQLRREE